MPAAPGDQQLPCPQEVFISYSRKDTDFVRRLDESLKSRGREAWVDWEDIRPTEDFMQAIHSAIEGVDTFVFVLTPESVAKLNWIFFPEGDDLEKAFEKATDTLISAFDTDLDWVHAHTRLLTRAI